MALLLENKICLRKENHFQEVRRAVDSGIPYALFFTKKRHYRKPQVVCETKE